MPNTTPTLKRVCKVLLACLVLLATGLQAAQVTIPGREDGRIRTVNYDPNNVITLPIAPLTATLVKFSDMETITSKVAGATRDPLHQNAAIYQVDVVPGSPNMLTIKAGRLNVPTNLIVVTQGAGQTRVYTFFITASASSKPIYQLTVNYRPHHAARAHYRHRNTHPNAAYVYSGDSAIVPTRVWDDGTFTYFTFGPHRAIPTVYVVTDSLGHTSLPTQEQQGNTVVVQQTAREFALWAGNQEADVLSLNPKPWQ